MANCVFVHTRKTSVSRTEIHAAILAIQLTWAEFAEFALWGFCFQRGRGRRALNEFFLVSSASVNLFVTTVCGTKVHVAIMTKQGRGGLIAKVAQDLRA